MDQRHTKNTPPVNYPELIVQKSTGLTSSEEELSSLGQQAFLDLWSYPNPFKKQKNGQELCDLLVIFEDTILIFSDKFCQYGEHSDPRVNWRRWYKKTIEASCQQLNGAKRWISEHPDRITLDAKNEHPFPLKIQITEKTQFHLIAIARGATEACIKYYNGGDGGLLLDTSIQGEQHTDENCVPFQVGLYSHEPEKFIHIFDDATYQILLRELDTIQDFTGYLNARKELLLTKSVYSCSEADLLSLHLSGLTKGDEGILTEYARSDLAAIVVEENQYSSLVRTDHYKAWKQQLEKSYFWDRLLQLAFHYLLNGQGEFTTETTLNGQNKIFHWMASEKRYYRSIYSDKILSLMQNITNNKLQLRIIPSLTHPDLCYLIILMPHPKNISEPEYRRSRRTLLSDYCYITKYRFPQYNHIIGIAHDADEAEYSSEDYTHLDASQWTSDDQQRAKEILHEYTGNGIAGNIIMNRKKYKLP